MSSARSANVKQAVPMQKDCSSLAPGPAGDSRISTRHRVLALLILFVCSGIQIRNSHSLLPAVGLEKRDVRKQNNKYL